MSAAPTKHQELVATARTDPTRPMPFRNAYEHAQILIHDPGTNIRPQRELETRYSTFMYVPTETVYTRTAVNHLTGPDGLRPTRTDEQQAPFPYNGSPLQQPRPQTAWVHHFSSPNIASYDSRNIPAPLSDTSHRIYSPGHSDALCNPCQPDHFYPTPVPDLGASAPRPQQLPDGAIHCEWDRGCEVPVEDTSPSGIGRHLRQHHDIVMIDNRKRDKCRWGGGCSKPMFPTNLGKHIAECHLRNLVKRCPYCLAEFARADTLARHIKGFCTYIKVYTELPKNQ